MGQEERQVCGQGQPSNQSGNETFEAVLRGYISRRALLKGGMAGLVLAAASPGFPSRSYSEAGAGFVPLRHSTEDRLLVPAGYRHTVLIRWGDPVIPGGPELDPHGQSSAKQALQFGYNCDFVGFMILPRGSGTSLRGLLVVNHEYTNPELMFPAWDGRDETKTRQMVDIELAAHGLSVIEVQREGDGGWSIVRDSPYSRRITGETAMRISSPAAGHPWLRTATDATGTVVRGTLNNCAGGITPWGTVLTAEENFQQYFGGQVEGVPDATVRAMHKRYGVRDEYGWARHHDRFDVTKEPREPLRFGWVVEVDPYDPKSVPVKRTALGRFRHEAATVVIARGGQAVVYSGDDERFEYLYKFVSATRHDATNRAANLGLLDAGTLYVARFRDDGAGEWLPLTFGQGPLTPASGFASQAEVLINTRGAADLLGATKMDRPEDVEANPRTGKVYAVMTNNTRRKPDQVDKANPRPDNKYGHIIELIEDKDDHAATTFRWEIFIAAGDPGNPEHKAYYQGRTDVSWFATPDNLAFDEAGRMWVATDGQPSSIRKHDALYQVETDGPQRGLARMFLSSPLGAEVCGPEFTPDNRTLFVAIQHPGEWKDSTFAKPASRWPDERANVPPRPSVVAIYRPDGGKIGT